MSLPREGLAETGWFKQYLQYWLAGAAHVYGLHGDIYGLTTEGIGQTEYLGIMLGKRDIVLYYDRERGFSFPLPDMRVAANQLLGPKNAGASSNPMAKVVSAASNSDDWFARPENVLEGLRLIERLLLVTDKERPNNPRPEKSAMRRVAVVVNRAELICPAIDQKGIMPDDARDILSLLARWGQDKDLDRAQNPIFLCVAKMEELHADLRSANSGIKFVEVPLPGKLEREAYVTRFLEDREEKKKPILFLDLSVQEFVNETAGLNLRHIEDIFLYGARYGGITHDLVSSRKRIIINSEYSKVAEMMRPLSGGLAALGGMEKVSEWMMKRIVFPIRKGSRRAPKGVFLVGPPGTGKTLLAQALTADIGFNAVALKVSKILSKYVGESEQNLADFFKLARALAPVLIFVDEIDQSDLGKRGGGENPVAGNLFNEMLQFMSDESLRGQVIVIFASNRPDLLDPAIMRPGRIDAVYPILLPTLEAREGIYRAQARFQEVEITEEAIKVAAFLSEDFSAADIMSIVAKSIDLMDQADRDVIGVEEVELALQYIKPSTPRTAGFFTEIAVRACTDRQYLDPKYASLLDDRKDLDKKISASYQDSMETAPYSRSERSW